MKNAYVSEKKHGNTFSNFFKRFMNSEKRNDKLNNNHDLESRSKHVNYQKSSDHLRRDGFRLKMSYDLYAQVNFDTNKRFAKLLDISYEGACVEFIERGQLPEKNSETQLQLLLPGYTESLSFPATIAWTNKQSAVTPSITIGLQFKAIDDKALESLCGFIWGSPR